MGWRPARSIPVLFDQLRPLAPDAPAVSWGTKGDDRHDSTSDHAPKDFPGWGNDIVTAGDFPKWGLLRPWDVLNSIRLSRDDRVKYGIADRQMFSSYAAHGYPAWTWRPYSLAYRDPHTDHGHLSLVGDRRADSTRLWVTSVKPQTQEEEPPMRIVLVTLTGRATVWVKVPGEPLRALDDENTVPLFMAAGAVAVSAKTAEAIVKAFGPAAGTSAADTIAAIKRAG